MRASAREEANMSVTPCLWFEGNDGEDAAKLYISLFPNSKMVSTSPGPDGKVLSLEFELDGRRFMGINGGPHATFNDAVSFSVSCETQDEVDRYWTALTADGGKEVQCGWLKDRWGVSWQIVPNALPRLLSDPDRAKAGRVAQAMMGMVKLDIAALEAAAKD
jgi:predicted 3-demethylubiquinone-9 3-methyltransferase (glyoxalase superfamily)